MLRLCLDLNIWVAALLADRKGRTNTGSQYLVEIVRSGSSPVGAVNLIISLGMLDELKSVIVEHLGLNIEIADAYSNPKSVAITSSSLGKGLSDVKLSNSNRIAICIGDRRIRKTGDTINADCLTHL